jgi:aminoglycoside phosphotransferase (APT) family kinase protein
MPETTHRDPEATAAALARWIEQHIEGADGVAVSGLESPPTNGFSSETILFEAVWNPTGGEVRRELVARVAPTGHTVFLNPDFGAECRVLRALSDATDVPVPAVVGIEPGTDALGAPFVVMERVHGQVPTDNPPYAAGGWVVDATPEEQERLWWSGIETMARIHRLDWRGLGLDFLATPTHGAPGVDHQLAYYREFLTWATDGRPQPVAEPALAWLEANRPAETAPLSLLWGDSRLGNVMYDDFECVAVLDWEMAGLGQPEMDLGWWLYYDRQFTTPIGLDRPKGFPSREATIERYGELLGRKMVDVEYYEVLAGFRFAVILARLAGLLMDSNILPMDSDFETNNLATQLLTEMLDLPAGA